MFKFVCFLPILQSLAGFLCVLTSCLQRLVLAALGDMNKEPASGCGFVWVRHMECGGRLWTSWGHLQAKYPPWLMGRLPVGVGQAESRVCTLLTLSGSSGCCSPSLSSPPITQHTLVSARDTRERDGPLWRCCAHT